MGKIRRFLLPDLLKKQEQEGSVGEEKQSKIVVPAEYLEEYNILQDYLESSKGEKVYPDSHLEIDLSMDSLDMVERSEEHTSELQSRQYLVCRLLLEKKKKKLITSTLKH